MNANDSNETEIDVRELKRKMDAKENFFLLDVREPNEFQIGRIPGSTLIPLGEVPQRVIQVLEEQINPAIASHGGYAELVAVEDSIAYLRLSGGCQGCGMASVTLSQGIEVAILDSVPEITEVVDVTDHAGGTNPYYQAAKK